jgi:hypothetical protein
MSTSKGSRRQRKYQRDLGHREALAKKMEAVGFVPLTRPAYLRAFDRFEEKLDRKTGATAKVRDARRKESIIRMCTSSSPAAGSMSRANGVRHIPGSSYRSALYPLSFVPACATQCVFNTPSGLPGSLRTPGLGRQPTRFSAPRVRGLFIPNRSVPARKRSRIYPATSTASLFPRRPSSPSASFATRKNRTSRRGTSRLCLQPDLDPAPQPHNAFSSTISAWHQPASAGPGALHTSSASPNLQP